MEKIINFRAIERMHIIETMEEILSASEKEWSGGSMRLL